MKIAVVGAGFVGVTSSVIYSSFGNQVSCLDIDAEKVSGLNQGHVPFYEPKLTELLAQSLAAKKLHFTTSYQEAISEAEVIIVAVGTPPRDDGSIDLSYLEAATESLVPYLQAGAVLAIKSTVLPGTIARVKKIVEAHTKASIHFASLPEFLKEGTAVDDTLYPDRIVIGVEDDFSFKQLDKLHAPLKAPIIRVRPESAQLAKYTSNDYLALRIIYANMVAEVCSWSGADIDEVLKIMGYDSRIGSHYWYPGLGYGGSCFPKDVKALAHYLKSFVAAQDNLFAFMDGLNTRRPTQVLELLERQLGTFSGKKVAVLGLAFKPNTDDQREAPALAIIPKILAAGGIVTSYDPMVKQIAAAEIATHPAYEQVSTIEQAIEDVDLVIALIEWPQIIGYDFSVAKVKGQPIFFDVRNQFKMQKIRAAGYHYLSIGRYKESLPGCGVR
jgi:UDPglucose 6-dehydrogenase